MGDAAVFDSLIELLFNPGLDLFADLRIDARFLRVVVAGVDNVLEALCGLLSCFLLWTVRKCLCLFPELLKLISGL